MGCLDYTVAAGASDSNSVPVAVVETFSQLGGESYWSTLPVVNRLSICERR